MKMMIRRITDMALFVFCMILLVAGFGLVFAAEIITLLIGSVVWAWGWRKGDG